MVSFIISLIFPIILLGVTIFFLYKAFKTTGDKSNKWNILATIISLLLTIYFSINIKPPAPIILPLDNETRIYSNSAEITIESDGFNIYYSLDGSDPKQGKKYEEPIIITSSTTVSARSKFLWKWSELSQNAYKFESVPITYSSDLDSFIGEKLVSVDDLFDSVVKGVLLIILCVMCFKAAFDGFKNLFK